PRWQVHDSAQMEILLRELSECPAEAEPVYCMIESRPPAGQRDQGMLLLTPAGGSGEASRKEAEEQPPGKRGANKGREEPETDLLDGAAEGLPPVPAMAPRPIGRMTAVRGELHSEELDLPKVEWGDPKNLPRGLSLTQQLLFLGFDIGLCEWAARRSLTLESAVSMLAAKSEAFVRL
ncbi:unnamed protein product, partial [Polarella glacialis]